MHAYETLTAPAEAAAPPSVEPDAVGSAAPVQQGDFAAGLRARPPDADACGTFATGISGSFTAAACTNGDFASGTRSSAGPRVIGDFATGMRPRDGAQLQADAADRLRADRERQELHWARA
jgi:hypothetical protein